MKRMLTLAIGLILALWGLTAQGVLAEQLTDPTKGCSGSWQQPDSEAQALAIDCVPGFASPHDRILVYPRNQADHGPDWRAGLDMSDAVWLFDAGAQNNASLIIDFHPDSSGPGLVADVYDGPTGSGQVPFQVNNGIPAPISHFPTVHVVAADGWWLKDGLINYNLDITVDGSVVTGWQSDNYLQLLKTDGRVDFHILVGDDKHQGRPNWELVREYPPLPSDDGVTRSALMVSPDGDQPIKNYLFWPLLSGMKWGLVQNYNERDPPIQVNWTAAKIDTIGEFVASRGAPNNWFTYSFSPFGPNEAEYANFENPFGFYDLGGKNDGYPDLTIRHVYNGPRDPFREQDKADQPVDIVRYSWDTQHRHLWDYKLDLFGRNPITTKVNLGPFTVDTIPHTDLPNTLLAEPWDIIAFVATDGQLSSEGIYASPVPARAPKYISGEDPRPLEVDKWDIEPGYRTDYRAAPGSHPELYFSFIDHQLHLADAQGGVWNLDHGKELRYMNLGGPYLNRWELHQNNEPQEALTFVDGQLIHETSAGISIKTVAADPAVFTAQPPSDHDSWAQLGALIEAHKAPFAGTDLAAMFSQFTGSAQTLPDAHIKNLHRTAEGFSFALDLAKQVPVGAPWAGLSPGAYLVNYQTGSGYSISPLAPFSLQFSSLQLFGDGAVVLQPSQPWLTVTNEGDDVAQGVQVVFSASQPGHPSAEIGKVALDIPGRQSEQARVLWAPPAPGEWFVNAEVTDGTGTRPAGQITVDVHTRSVNVFSLWAATQLGARLAGPVGAFLAITLLAGCIATAGWATRRRGTSERQEP